MIRDQTTGTSIQADTGALENKYENRNSATDMPKKDVMLHKQPSLEWGENLMRSLDHVAKEIIEMKIAEPDLTAIEVPQLNITAPESHTACTKFVGLAKVAESASTRTHFNELGNEVSKPGDQPSVHPALNAGIVNARLRTADTLETLKAYFACHVTKI